MVAAGPFHPAFIILLCGLLPTGRGNRQPTRRYIFIRFRGLFCRKRALQDNWSIVFWLLNLIGGECFDCNEIFPHLSLQILGQDDRLSMCLTFHGSLRFFLSRERNGWFLLLKVAQFFGCRLGLTAHSRILVG